MKKLLLGTAAIVTIATVNTAHAQDLLDRATAQPYIGLYGGYGWTDGDVTGGNSADPSGADYGVFAGIAADALLDATVNQSGLGLTGAIEVHYGLSNADDTIGTGSIEKESEMGISFRPGFTFLNDNAYGLNPYGIIGYRRTNYEVNAFGLTADEDYSGFELGFGAEMMVDDNMGLRAEYSHVWYGEEGGYDPSEGDFRVGLSYRF